ncbi:MAG: YihY/virulence factor BrkB family protein [Firmicutes bacterium]|nr:YihY/virulence factor BrkB family protein [Bacillota bacterium]
MMGWKTFRHFWGHVRARELGLHAQALAFSLLFALGPLLLVLAAELSHFHEPARRALFAGPLNSLVAPALKPLLFSAAGHLTPSHRRALLSLGIGGFLWAMTNAMRQIMRTLSPNGAAANHPRAWGQAIVRPAAVGLTVGILMIIAESLMAIGPHLLRRGIIQALGPSVAPWAAEVARWIAVVGILWIILTFIYSGLARPAPRFRWWTPGSAVVTPAWILLSWGFVFYTTHWATTETLYGSLGAVILLMIYLNILSYALLMGGELNRFIAQARSKMRQHRDD